MVSPYYALFKQHMVQHGSTYQILRTMQALSTGDLDVLPPPEFDDFMIHDIRRNLQQAHERHERAHNTRSRPVEFRPGQEVYRRSFAQSDFAKAYNAKLGKQ